MANVARPGAALANLGPNKSTFLTGMTRGTIPFGQWQNGVPQPIAQGTLSGNGPLTVVVKPITPKAGLAVPGAAVPMTPGIDFYEKIHILPRPKIEFGNIISLETAEYEIYNAFRDEDKTLSSITNNALPGVDTPDITPPQLVPKQTSVLDAATTGNGGGVGLGTIVKTELEATPTGLASFDTDIVFNFTGTNSVTLLVSGNRVVLFPFQYEVGLTEFLTFFTDIIEAFSGKEQRISIAKVPRQGFQNQYLLTGNERQRAQVLLMDWMDNIFGLPLWHEDIEVTAPITLGSTIYPVSGADTVDFRLGGLALILTDNNTFDVINIVGLTPTQITASDPSLNAYPAGTPIMPLRVARIKQSVNARRSHVKLESFDIRWEVTDNDTGAPTGDGSGFSTHNGRVLLDDCNVSNGAMPESYIRRLFVIDNQSGLVSVTSPWDRFKRVSEKGFSADNRAEIYQLRQLLYLLNGKQRAFYVPTFFDDLEVKADLVFGAATFDIENIEYTRFAQSRDPKNIAKFTFTDGTSLVRDILSSVGVDPTTERLTTSLTWPASRTVSEIVRVEFYELVRFDTDEFRLDYPRVAQVELSAPVKAVFDDI